MKIKIKEEKEEENSWGLKSVFKLAITIIVYGYIFFLLVLFAFYFKDGYTQIATTKFTLFRSVSMSFAWALIPLAIIHHLLPGRYKENRNIIEKIKIAGTNLSWTDFFVFLYACINLLSYWASDSKGEAIWGTSGWYMGLGTQLICIGIYFFVSRYSNYKYYIMPVILISTFLLYSWGLLNRFSIYPISMTYSAPQFISSMGNINWFSGYWSVFFSTGVVLYWIRKSKIERIIYGIYTTVALALGIVEGSESAYLSIFLVFVILFFFSFNKSVSMKNFLEIVIMIAGACQIMRVITILFPNLLNMTSEPVELMLGNITLFVLLLGILFRILFTVSVEKKEQRNGDMFLQKWKWIRSAILILLVIVFLLYLILLILNTLQRGSIGLLSENNAFIFSESWANGRGATWKDGFLMFGTFSFWQKLIGVGPDCFAAYGYANNTISEILVRQFDASRLTNAHNECITLLDNIGILGLASFLGMVGSVAIRSFKKAIEVPYAYVYGICVLSYFVHNMFSFQQIENLPFFFLALGLGEQVLRTQQQKG